MAQDDAFVGIDVAKHELVVHLYPDGDGWRVANSSKGLRDLAVRLARVAHNRVLRIGFEASGGYERNLAILLESKGFEAYLLDPARVRSFAKAEGKRAKTDPLDAAVIARALATLHTGLKPWRHDPAAQRLAERIRLRDQFMAQMIQSQNLLETTTDAVAQRMTRAHVANLKAKIQRLDKIIADLIAENPVLCQRAKLLRSAPGVGPVVAATMLAHMPELGSITGKQAAALAGIAPFDRQSGTSNKPGRCQGGRPAVRRALYLAALSILRTKKSYLAALGLRLKTQGRPFKVAVIATARKLLVALNAMLKDSQPFLSA